MAEMFILTHVCMFCMSVCACLIDVHLSEGDNSGWADLFDQSFKRVYPQDLATGCRKFTPNPIITSSHFTFLETQFRPGILKSGLFLQSLALTLIKHTWAC